MNLALEQIIWMMGNAFLAKVSFENNSNFMGWFCLFMSAWSMSKALVFIFKECVCTKFGMVICFCMQLIPSTKLTKLPKLVFKFNAVPCEILGLSQTESQTFF